MAGLKATVPLVVKPLLLGSMASVVTALVFVIAELALRFYLGEISGWELATGVMISALMAGTASFIVSGVIMGIALAFPVLLPFFQIVMVPLVGCWIGVNASSDKCTDEWMVECSGPKRSSGPFHCRGIFSKRSCNIRTNWSCAQGLLKCGPISCLGLIWTHIPRVDAVGFISELGQNVSDLDLEFAWLDSVGGAIAGTSNRAVEALPDWRLAVPSWKFDIGSGRFTPDFELLEQLPALDMDLKALLADVGMPSLRKLTVSLPDFGVANRSAQDALASAATYLTARGSAGLEQPLK